MAKVMFSPFPILPFFFRVNEKQHWQGHAYHSLPTSAQPLQFRSKRTEESFFYIFFLVFVLFLPAFGRILIVTACS